MRVPEHARAHARRAHACERKLLENYAYDDDGAGGDDGDGDSDGDYDDD